MKLNKKRKLALVLLLIFWLPFIIISINHQPYKNHKKLPLSEAVIVFGTLVHGNDISPLMKERLDAGIATYISGKALEIVVSNKGKASLVMQQYLLKKGIPPSAIILDTTAEKTPDTCRYERHIHPNPRKLIFVSQGYHLARIRYQCKKLGVTAVTFPAENIRKNRASFFSSFNVFTVRTKRYVREAGLTWLAFLTLYE